MYAFEQDVPISANVHDRIMAALGDVHPAGLLAHIAIEREGGHVTYIDLWQSKAECDRFTDERLHPIVGSVLAEAGVKVAGEPPRNELKIVAAWGPAFAESAPTSL